MASYRIAHIREQGVDLIIVPLDSAFGYKSQREQNEIIGSLQLCARAAGLGGTVVPVWREGNSHRFVAPSSWHSFFKSLSYQAIVNSLNKDLTCN